MTSFPVFTCLHLCFGLVQLLTSPFSCLISPCFTIRLRPFSTYPDEVKKHRCDTSKGRDMIYFPCLLSLARLPELALPPQPYQESDRSLSFLPTQNKHGYSSCVSFQVSSMYMKLKKKNTHKNSMFLPIYT